ncbi:PREDICTED: leucine zipper putative tumor suppressor 2 [Ficedula albicollis]|uniref:leucine zipper putative tumor suppressor 2 n=1 Tax=Ficedula albicollis TaxID=59894 RepID=UPI0007AD85FF|nr:PREDICTED: leucine zipper putative tumor suppressor 2 [Ficedula albicollis]
MAIVQTLPVPLEAVAEGAAQLRTTACSPPAAMGSVGSLLPVRPRHDCATDGDPSTASFCKQDGLLRAMPEEPRVSVPGATHSYANGGFCGDWLDASSPASPCSDSDDLRDDQAPSDHLRGPPPKLVPVSGKLEENVEKTLIRPMAFKPVVSKLRNAQPCTRLGLSESQVNLTHLLGAEKPGSLSCRASTLSDSGRNSLSSLPTYSTGCSQHPEVGALPTTPHGPLDPLGTCRPSNSDSGRSSSSKSTGSLSGRGRPSSESGSCGRSPLPGEEAMLVRELEDKLREREAELRLLRDSLDENEVAICQVFEEKQRRCEQELEGLRQRCAAQARQAAHAAHRGQQVLQLQVLQLQQEKKQLQEDLTQLLQERELLERRCASFQRERTELAPRLEETKWEVCQKSGEISLLKQQLKEAQAELAQRGAELLGLRAQLREARAQLQAGERRPLVGLREAARGRCPPGTGEGCPPPGEGCPSASEEPRGSAGLRRQRRRGQEQRDAFEQERGTWQGEKERVIRYQKQLQYSYIQMYRRNRRLEQRLQQLRLQGEDPLPEPCDPPDLPFEEITATEI